MSDGAAQVTIERLLQAAFIVAGWFNMDQMTADLRSLACDRSEETR